MWELFGRFGITAILVLYLTKTLHFTDAKAFAVYSAFIALIFVMPMVGGVLCDRILGHRHSIILGGATIPFSCKPFNLSWHDVMHSRDYVNHSV